MRRIPFCNNIGEQKKSIWAANALFCIEKGKRMKEKSEQQKAFYRSDEWRKCRDAYYKKKHGLCERCLEHGMINAGEIVHHKEHLDAINVYDPTIALNENNLQVLCRKCHGEMHREHNQRYRVDSTGRIYTG